MLWLRASISVPAPESHVIRGVVDVEQRVAGCAAVFKQHERQLHFNTRDDKRSWWGYRRRHGRPTSSSSAVIRFALISGSWPASLLRSGRFVAFERAPFGNLDIDPFALYGIGIFNSDVGIIQRHRSEFTTLFFSSRDYKSLSDQVVWVCLSSIVASLLRHSVLLAPGGDAGASLPGLTVRYCFVHRREIFGQRATGERVKYLNNACTLFCL